jgi:hypothetical protein
VRRVAHLQRLEAQSAERVNARARGRVGARHGSHSSSGSKREPRRGRRAREWTARAHASPTSAAAAAGYFSPLSGGCARRQPHRCRDQNGHKAPSHARRRAGAARACGARTAAAAPHLEGCHAVAHDRRDREQRKVGHVERSAALAHHQVELGVEETWNTIQSDNE